MNNGDIILFQQGKNDRQVAYTNSGKIILSKESIPCGYASVKNFEELPRCFIVDAEHLYAHDYFKGIVYQEFLQLLSNYNFNVIIDREFRYIQMPDSTTEHQILAIHNETNVILYAETFDNGSCFNTVEIYIPGQNGLLSSLHSLRVMGGSKDYAVFNIANVQGGMSEVMKIAYSIPQDRRVWKEDPLIPHDYDDRQFFDGEKDFRKLIPTGTIPTQPFKGMRW